MWCKKYNWENVCRSNKQLRQSKHNDINMLESEQGSYRQEWDADKDILVRMLRICIKKEKEIFAE